MKHILRIVTILILSASLPACGLPPASPTANPAPTAAPLPTLPPQPSPTPPLPTLQPTPLPSAAPAQPPAQIMIQSPGRLSAVVPPVLVSGEAEPTFEQTLVITVSDAFGEVIALQPVTIQADVGQRGAFSASIDFAVQTGQPGRISVYSASPKDGGLVALESVPVTLMLPGDPPEIKPQPLYPYPQPIQILSPALVYQEGGYAVPQVSGGVLAVSGYSSVGVFESTLALALCGEGGSGAPEPVCGTADNVLAQGYAMLDAEMGQPGFFAGEVAYSVSAPVNARVAVYIASMRDGAVEMLASVPVVLAP